MAQLLLMGVNLVCNLPAAKVVGPVVASLIPISPLNIVTYLVWLFVLKLSPAKWTKKLAPTWKKAALYALMFYFLTVIPIYFLLIFLVCKATG